MKIQDRPPVHLTYCLNVHPGQTWAENFAAIRDKAAKVRDRLGTAGPFGLGLRLGDEAAATLIHRSTLQEFKAYLDANGMYAFTINGFPFGRFHGSAVKQDVYAPDWRTPQRRDYTNRLADILGELLPEGVAGSISTVPISYKAWIQSDRDVEQMGKMLADSVAHLQRVEESTGRHIRLALEPEPDCFLETTAETVEFFKNLLPCQALRRYVGVCLDTAHAAVEFEDPAESLAELQKAGVCVAKVQISSALSVRPTEQAMRRLAEFCDPVYLHQVKARCADGRILSFADLPAAMEAFGGGQEVGEEWRIHFHVPLFWTGDEVMRSTSHLLTGELAAMLRAGASEHLEIETYTFHVLPEFLRAADVTDSIAREYQWVMADLLKR